MNKDEARLAVMGAISMALKDPTLQQGFEIICKENAELKGLKDVATLIRANNDTVTTLMQLNNMLVSKSQQLTKAKELLKEFVQHYKAKTIYIENMQDLLEQSEQFLKE